MKGSKFLILDTDKSNRLKLSTMVSNLGNCTDQPEHPGEASVLLDRERYDCVLIDRYTTPGWLVNLGKQKARRQKPMVFMTGPEETFAERGFMIQTADGYLPINHDSIKELCKHIEKGVSVTEKLIPGLVTNKEPIIQSRFDYVECIDEPQIIIRTSRIVKGSPTEDVAMAVKRADNSYGILFGDLTGDILSSHRGLSNLKTYFAGIIKESTTITGLMNSINDVLMRSDGSVDFMTAITMNADLKRKRLTYLNAGHLPPLYRRWGGRAWRSLNGTGIPLGISDNLGSKHTSIRVVPGDRILLLSDGILKADGRIRQYQDFNSLICRLNTLPFDLAPHEIIESIEEIVGSMNGAGLADEFTVMLLQF